MAFRDEVTAARLRRDKLEEELVELRQSSALKAVLLERERALSRELAELGNATRRTPHRLDLLDTLTIASPCSVPWDDMEGDATIRFCDQCEKQVYNLSAMSRDEAEAFLRTRDGRCVRFYKRVDGTVMTNDCPVGVEHKRRRRRFLAAFAVIALGSVLLNGLAERVRRPPPAVVQYQGL